MAITPQLQADCYRLRLSLLIHSYIYYVTGGIIPSKNYFFIKHVDPSSPPNDGGGAGYRPRVRNPYSKQRLLLYLLLQVATLLYIKRLHNAKSLNYNLQILYTME